MVFFRGGGLGYLNTAAPYFGRYLYILSVISISLLTKHYSNHSNVQSFGQWLSLLGGGGGKIQGSLYLPVTKAKEVCQ